MAGRISQRRKQRIAPDDRIFRHMLDPIDQLSETIFSVLIMLTFTLAFRIFRLGGDPGQPIEAVYVNELLIGAISATLAWGIIDGVMYALMELFQRAERHRLLGQIKAAANEQEGVEIVAAELDYILEPISDEADRQALYRSVYAQLRKSEPRPIRFTRDDLAGALGSLLVAVVAVLPSLVPFVVLRNNYALAVRVSNLVSFGVLFIAGYRWGKHTGSNPWRMGLTLVAVGVVLVAIAIPLGG